MKTDEAGTIAGLKFLVAVCLAELSKQNLISATYLDLVAKMKFPGDLPSETDVMTSDAANEALRANQGGEACIADVLRLARELAGAPIARPGEAMAKAISPDPGTGR